MADVSRPATVLDVQALPTVAQYGYDGGRTAFQRFCLEVFKPGAPRLLRTEGGALAMFRHADVRAMSTVPQLATLAPNQIFPGLLDRDLPEEKPVGFAIADLIKNQLFTANGPLSPALRRVLLNQIGPKPTAERADATRTIAKQLIGALPTGAPIDVVQQIAEPMIGRFWGDLIGMPESDALAATVEARRMTPMLFLKPDQASFVEADNAAKAYRDLVEGAGQRTLASGGCPFVQGLASDLAAIGIADDLDFGGYVPKTVGAFLAGNLFDGFHTAALAVTNTIYQLLLHPDVMQTLRSSPDKISAAVSECLRLEPPVIHLSRIASADFEHDGHIIRAGTQVQMMWGVANRDPEAFPNPDEFDMSRSQQGATTFGGGSHICPGRFAALLMAKSVVEALVESGIDLQLSGADYSWIENNAMCQFRELPVVVSKLN